MRTLLISICFSVLLFGNTGYAQEQLVMPVDPLAAQMHWYNLAKPSSMLFVHFDKTIYTNNETVWFTGYLLNELKQDITKHNVMSVALVRNADSSIVKQQKYLMQRALSFGSMVLPDSMLTGDYHLQASTNRVSNGIPEVIFIQPITIKTNISPAFNASIKMLEPGIINKKPNQLLLSVTTQDSRFLPKPVDVSYRYGKVSKKTKTNVSGELLFNLAEQPDLTDPNVYVQLKYGQDSSFLNLSLPITRKKAEVRFYPEGGNLIEDIPVHVAWEVKDQQQAIVTLKAQLFKDGKIIDTIETNSNGIGKFLLNAEKGSTYYVKLMHSGFADSTYILPRVLNEGIGLYAPTAAVKDTLTVMIKNRQKERFFVRVHNFKESFIYTDLNIKVSSPIIKIPLDAVPKGLMCLTISDSLDRPVAERMFFAHYDPSRTINVSTDQQTYGQRQKVTLKIGLNMDSLAMVSIACVQDSRLSPKLTTDIESYTYLTSQLGTLPLYNKVRGYEDPDYLNDMLLVKGWRRYTWQDMIKTEAADTLNQYDDMAIKLQVTRARKTIDKPIQIGLMKTSKIDMLATDDHGNFEFKTEDLTMTVEKPVYVIVGQNDNRIYQIKVTDPYPDLNKSYLKLFNPEYRAVPSSVQNNSMLSIKSNEHAIRLKEVQITSRKGDDEIRPTFGTNRCGDYVCKYNILNCINHIGDANNTIPLPGHTYRSRTGSIIYHMCEEVKLKPNMVIMEGIYSKKEFYLNDYAQPLEPAFVSTIYWNNGILLNRKEKEVTFYTSDITGKFRIIVQGVSTSDVLYGEHYFEVKGK